MDESVGRGWTHRNPLPTQPTPLTARPPVGAPVEARHSAEFEAISVLLARNIGPIAKIFVEKASAEAQSIDELCERLSQHVRTPADRVAFLKAAQAQLSSLRTR